MKAKEIFIFICKKVGYALLWMTAFLLWLVTSILETQLKQLNKVLHRFLFPPKQ